MKKITALFLLLAFVIGFGVQKCQALNPNGGSLKEFISTVENISANYEYPSLKIASSTGKTCLAAHTPIVIRNDKPITTNDIVNGDSIIFSVVNDIKDETGKILISKGSQVSANIFFEKTGKIGKSGKLTISDFHTTAVDGTYVPLSSSISINPDDKMILSIALSICLCPLFLLMKGENAELPEGTVKTVYTTSSVYINAGVR